MDTREFRNQPGQQANGVESICGIGQLSNVCRGENHI
jgi:hypothetical protein